MHESMFSYNLSRPYPYKWFTWVVFTGDLVATAIFTVVNMASDGYYLGNVYSGTPNRTMGDASWFQKRPWSWASKLSSSCQLPTFAVGDNLQTQYLALTYTVTSATHSSNADAPPLVSFPYLNNYMECNITLIELNIQFPDSASAEKLGAKAQIWCYFADPGGFTILELSADFPMPLGTSTNSAQKPVVWPSLADEPSLCWGFALSNWYNEVYFFNTTAYGNGSYYEGQTSNNSILVDFNFGGLENPFAELHNLPQIATDVYITYLTVENTTSGGFSSQTLQGLDYRPVSEWMNESDYLTYNTIPLPSNLPVPGAALNGLAKAVYSTVLTDLGQAGGSNMLVDPGSTLFMFKQAKEFGETNPDRSHRLWSWYHLEQQGLFGSMTYHYEVDPAFDNPPLGNSTAFFEYYNSSLPSVKPSTIAAQYLCQVPLRRLWGSLLVSIIVADLVLLQVFWKSLSWVVTFGLERRHPEAKYCLGCAKQLQHAGYEMVPTTPPIRKEGNEVLSFDTRITNKEVSDDDLQSLTRSNIQRRPVGSAPSPGPWYTATEEIQSAGHQCADGSEAAAEPHP